MSIVMIRWNFSPSAMIVGYMFKDNITHIPAISDPREEAEKTCHVVTLRSG